MKGKNILILGAGLMQKPAILAARRTGHTVVVVDADPHALCVPFADVFRQIDLKDRTAIADYAGALQKADGLAAVFTAGTDFSASVSYAAEKAGTQAHSFEAALNASSKTRMRSCFKKSGVPSPDFFSIDCGTSAQQIDAMIEHLGFPCVIKPADNMGARGCRMIRNKSEAESALKNALGNSRTGHAILEQYMEGPEYSIDALIYNGTMTITGFADRHIYYPPYFIETGHTMPTSCSDKQRSELIAVFALGARSLGLTCGAAKADIKYTDRGPMIGEIAARLSGGYMSGWTFPYASGCNLTEQALALACGEEPAYLLSHRVSVPFAPPASCSGTEQPYELYDLPCHDVSAERAYISIPGTIASITGNTAAGSVKFVRDVLPRNIGAGDTIDFPRNNVQKCGNVIACAPSRDAAVSAAEKACSLMTLRLAPHNEKTEAFLRGESLPDENGFPPSAYQYPVGTVSGILPRGASAASHIPEQLLSIAESSARDWNYMTFSETLSKFDQLCPDHPSLDADLFWHAIIRGGIQGALYISDCASFDEVQR